jgi:DNA-binding winged helix-turn-helix (wHTH) protein
MMGEAQTSNRQVLIFGPFSLHMSQRVLREGERPIRLGSRALEILLLLVERAGELVGKDELIARVWPNLFVEETTLRVHVAALRKALGHNQSGARYIESVTGRGYRFVAPVTHSEDDGPASIIAAGQCRLGWPALLIWMIGCSDTVGALVGRLPQQRLVTITEPGSVGKTTVGLAAAEKLASSYSHGASFVELTSVTDLRLIASTLASALGLEVPSDDPVPAVLTFLGDKQLLIVLDNCEHVIDAAACLAEVSAKDSLPDHKSARADTSRS